MALSIEQIYERFHLIFGFIPGKIPTLPQNNQPDNPYKQIPLLGEDDAAGMSLLGTPLFDVLTIEAGKTIPDTEHPEGEDYPEYKFMVDPLIELGQKKEIVETKIVGRKGIVKEMINLSDYSISIKGLIVSGDGTFPDEEVELLKRICEVGATLSVNSKLFNIFGITNMVIYEATFQPIQGFPDTQPFEITAVADDGLDIVLLEEID